MTEFSPEVEAVCAAHSISSTELLFMLRHSAPYTHIWANRRWKFWLFDADMADPSNPKVFKMEKLSQTP